MHTELLHYDVRAVLDLTSCDGAFALFCAKHKVSYLGITFGEEHKRALDTMLKEELFKSYWNPQSDDFDAELAQVMLANAPTRKTASKMRS